MTDPHIREYPRQVGLRITQGILQFFFLLVLARTLTPADFGLFAVATIFTTACGILAEFGLVSALVQKESLDDDDLNSIFWVLLVFSLLFSVVLFSLAHSIEILFSLASLARVIQITVIVVPLIALQAIPRAQLSREFRFSILAVIDVAATAAGIAAALALLLREATVWVFVVQLLVTAFVRVVWLWSVTRWKPSFNVRWRSAAQFFRFGGNVTGFNLLNFVGKYFDDAIVGRVLGAYSLGLYNFSYRIITFQQEIVSGAMNRMVLSVYARSQSSRKEVFRILCRDTQLIVTVSLPILAWFIAVAPVFVPAVFGSRWTTAVPVMQVFALEAMRQSLLSLAGSAMLAVGDSRRFMLYAVVSTPVLVISFLIGVQWGIFGVAASFFIFNSGLMFFLLFLLKRSFSVSFKPLFLQWLPGVVLACVIWLSARMWILAVASSRDFWLWCGIAIIPGLLGYFAVCGFFAQPFTLLHRALSAATRLLRRKNKAPTKVIYLDPLWSGSNPHLSQLHKLIAEQNAHFELRELNFRRFFFGLPKITAQRTVQKVQREPPPAIILHFHFIIRVYDHRSALIAFLKAVRFLAGLAICRLTGMKVIWTFHDDRAHDFSHRNVESFFLSAMAAMSDSIITLSMKGSKILWERFGRDENVIFTPHPSYKGMYSDAITASHARQQLGVHKNEKVYLFFGKVLPYKGVSDLLFEFRNWNPEIPARLVLAGEFRDAHMKHEAEDAAAHDKRILVIDKHIADDDVQLYMRAADFGVLPYREILHSGTAMLFAAFDVPIIAPNRGWFPEIFQRYNVGIMYDDGEKSGLHNTLQESLRREKEQYAEAIRKWCNEWSLSNAAAMTADVYENCDR